MNNNITVEYFNKIQFTTLLTKNHNLINIIGMKNVNIVRDYNYEYILINKIYNVICKKIICIENNIQIIYTNTNNYIMDYIPGAKIYDVIFLR